MSQEQLANAAGISSVKMIESGKNYGRIETLSRIAEALDTSVASLLADPENVLQQPMPRPLTDFLASPFAKDVSAEEVNQIRYATARLSSPTIETFYLALQMIRSAAGPTDR